MKPAAFFLRIAIGTSYIWEVADRFGILGPHGHPHVGWGSWNYFLDFARQVMSFMPVSVVPALAVLATIGEGGFGILLILGLFTRQAAIGSGILSFCFGLSMAISFGIDSPLGYSVFTLSAASFLLAAQSDYIWAMENLFHRVP
jgi:putative oxidoreductase